MKTIFNENSRVKIPALVHLTRLGYQYLSLKDHTEEIDGNTNIFKQQFKNSINKINHVTLDDIAISRIITELTTKLSGDDVGKAFFNCLQDGINGYKLIDFNPEHRDWNTFQIVTELTYKNEDDEFRPDITLLINGMPLAFIEVKKPNNHEGIIAERNRINDRFKNKKFRRFANITQLLLFTNNQEYDVSSLVPIEGSFYGTADYESVIFNCFREENTSIYDNITPIDETIESFILKDTNLASIRWSAEYETNKNPRSPANRTITSLFSKDRLMFFLKYGFAYVEKANAEGIKVIKKHVMRYPQFFATLAIQQSLESGKRKGVIWHTQGSGKTALAYFNVHTLTDYFQNVEGKVVKFYFIVDRLDLLTQAAGEFRSRGLTAVTVNSKEEFIENIGKTAVGGSQGERAINVVNIQKFSTESIATKSDYNIDVQRVYFLDEAHRSYNPKGSFLANLMNSDRNAVIIALTGTPLISREYNTKDIFGSYIHQYYYNQSIADGYTLKLIREGIETKYKTALAKIADDLEALKGSIKSEDVFSHPKYVAPLTEYIVNDFHKSRIRFNKKIGGMIVCDSSKQAREVFRELRNYHEISSALILHNEDDKQTRREEQDKFKNGEIDLLVVYNMLLTGFDAPILKKLYLGRLIKQHNLLQCLTRVNRPYKDFEYGFVVDFADIREEFDKTNKAYFAELQSELGNDFEKYSEIFKTQKEIEEEIAEIENTLFVYDTENVEMFQNQISEIDDKMQLLSIRRALSDYKELYNLIRLLGYNDQLKRIDISQIQKLFNEVNNRIAIINYKESLQNSSDSTGLLNEAFDQIQFVFRKISEEEMVIADAFHDILNKVRRELSRNRDIKDPEYISLKEILENMFKKKNIEELDAASLKEHIKLLEDLRERAKKLNDNDDMLCRKYGDDAKFMRVHKHLKRRCPEMELNDVELHRLLMSIKQDTDEKLLMNSNIINNEEYFVGQVRQIAIDDCKKNNVPLAAKRVMCLQKCISQEYILESQMAVS